MSAISGAETPPMWEFGFYDSEEPDRVYWSAFGGIVGFTSPEMAEHTASKNVWGQAVIVRRHPGDTEWEIVPKSTCASTPSTEEETNHA